MDTSQRLETLRGLLHTPSPEGWRALCDLLTAWPEPEDLSIGLDYAHTHLTSWPDKLRVAPRPWAEDLLASRTQPRLALARALLLPQPLWMREDLETLWRSDLLADLTHLDLRAGPSRLASGTWKFPAERLRQVVAAPFASKLTHLGLHAGPIDEASAHVLAEAESLSGLTSLHLVGVSGMTIGSTWELRALGASTTLENLQSLALSDCTLGDFGAKAFIEGTAWRNLRHLDLSKNVISGKALSWGRIKTFPHLTHLNMSGNALGKTGTVKLGRAKILAGLTDLDISHCRLDNLGALAFVEHRVWDKVTRLSLAHNFITAWGIQKLAPSPRLAPLQSLDLSGNRIEDEGAQAIAEAPHLAALEHLDISKSTLTWAGVSALVTSEHLPALKHLDVHDNDGIKGDPPPAVQQSKVEVRI